MDELEKWRKAGYWTLITGAPVVAGIVGVRWCCSIYPSINPSPDDIITVGGDDYEVVLRTMCEMAAEKWPSAVPVIKAVETLEVGQ